MKLETWGKKVAQKIGEGNQSWWNRHVRSGKPEKMEKETYMAW